MAMDQPTKASLQNSNKSQESGGLPQGLSDRLERLSLLPENWDGYGASPISPQVIRRAELVLKDTLGLAGDDIPLPFIAPAGDGTVVLEWKTATGKELVLDIPEKNEPLPFFLVEPAGLEAEAEIEGVIGEIWTLAGIINRLKAK